MKPNSIIVLTIFFAVLATNGCDRKKAPLTSAPKKTIPTFLGETDTAIYRTNASEDLILRLTKDLIRLKSKFIGQADDFGNLFNPSVGYLGPENLSREMISQNSTLDSNRNASFDWPLMENKTLVPASKIWDAIQSTGLTEFQLGISDGSFPEDHLETFHMTTVIEGKLKSTDSLVQGIKAKQLLVWSLDESGSWKIDQWIQKEFTLISSPSNLFADITKDVIRSQETLSEIRHAVMADLLIAEAEKRPHTYSDDLDFRNFKDWRSSSQYPSVSVVDFDGDGWEDLFFTSGYGRTFLMRNMQGTHFEDVTKERGLFLENSLASCSLFADFDNDGDPDVLIGRTTQPSQYYENQDGMFVANSDVNQNLLDCKFVTAGSVADVNGDGLLDVYLSTYCVHGSAEEDWIKSVVPKPQQNQFAKILSQNRDNILDRPGPPNILLVNKGGVLEPAAIQEPLLQWRNSYQSVWMDVDRDGDPDLYICNDFSKDVLLRNDTEKGTSRFQFTDISEQFFAAPLTGFGMGASVGDYDSDGLLDLYVSNMYSKAGHRIFKQIGGSVDPKLKIAAQGNFLYRNTGKGFEQVASLTDGQHVSKVGWSFGGQMADFNNDGQLDIYVPSGLFTAPEKIKAQEDL